MNCAKTGGSIWEDWYGILFTPSDAIKRIAVEQCKLRAAFTLIITLLPLWAVFFALRQANELSGVLFSLHIAVELLIWFCGSAVFHLAASLAGGRGESVGLFCALGYTGLPQLYFIPIAAIAQFQPAAFRIILLAAAIIMLTAWTAWLKVLALKECYDFSTAKSVLVFLTPLFLLISFAVFGIIVIGGSVLASTLN